MSFDGHGIGDVMTGTRTMKAPCTGRRLTPLVSEIGLVTALGVGSGLVGGIAVSRFITALLYEVEPSNIWSIAAPLACLFFACVASELLPALRAARIEPVTALRYE